MYAMLVGQCFMWSIDRLAVSPLAILSKRYVERWGHSLDMEDQTPCATDTAYSHPASLLQHFQVDGSKCFWLAIEKNNRSGAWKAIYCQDVAGSGYCYGAQPAKVSYLAIWKERLWWICQASHSRPGDALLLASIPCPRRAVQTGFYECLLWLVSLALIPAVLLPFLVRMGRVFFRLRMPRLSHLRCRSRGESTAVQNYSRELHVFPTQRERKDRRSGKR